MEESLFIILTLKLVNRKYYCMHFSLAAMMKVVFFIRFGMTVPWFFPCFLPPSGKLVERKYLHSALQKRPDSGLGCFID